MYLNIPYWIEHIDQINRSRIEWSSCSIRLKIIEPNVFDSVAIESKTRSIRFDNIENSLLDSIRFDRLPFDRLARSGLFFSGTLKMGKTTAMRNDTVKRHISLYGRKGTRKMCQSTCLWSTASWMTGISFQVSRLLAGQHGNRANGVIRGERWVALYPWGHESKLCRFFHKVTTRYSFLRCNHY